MATHHAAIWRIRLSLLEVEPEIWRRLEVPATVTFAQLHDVIQAVMGWDDAHLYSFDISGRVIDAEQGAHRVRLDAVCRPGETLGYTYDFGDTWEHAVVIEAAVPALGSARYPRCLDGANACPPEDCGGPWGYADLQATLAGGRSPEKTELLEWLGGRFDPRRFSVAQANARLARARKRGPS
jgi:Plasmid pRiA4b ORF-3-like protein